MSAPTQCPERNRTSYHGVVQCTEPVGHDKCHATYRDGNLLCFWLDRGQVEAARARGDYDPDVYCECEDPRPVCGHCGGEIL